MSIFNIFNRSNSANAQIEELKAKVAEYEAQAGTQAAEPVDQVRVEAPADAEPTGMAMATFITVHINNKNRSFTPDNFNTLYVDSEMSYEDVCEDMFPEASLDGITQVTLTRNGVPTAYSMDDTAQPMQNGDILAMTRTSGRGA